MNSEEKTTCRKQKKNLVVIFPGVGYHCDMPLLYEVKRIAEGAGYEIREVNYGELPPPEQADAKKKNECFAVACRRTEEALRETNWDAYDDVAFIGKSIGTAVAAYYAGAHALKPRFVLFTPLLETFTQPEIFIADRANESESAARTIAFSGTSDPWTDTEKLKEVCAKHRIPLYLTAHANHSLEVREEKTERPFEDLISLNLSHLKNTMRRTEEFLLMKRNPNLDQCVNPYLPSWEYIPDGEPYVFGDRVYVYGSHDCFAGDVYCMLDYVCWSAPVDDLGAWRYEGVIYKKEQDPDNADGSGMLYAPDVAQGTDGRFYLYYAIHNRNHISVAVCDAPAGQYEFYGYVHYSDGTRLGDLAQDEMQFDPGVLCEGNRTYLYTGFCPADRKERHGPMMTVLDSDMVTILEAPVFVAPSAPYSAGTGFAGHEFFEAPSIRKIGEKYCFIYSSIKFHELCYAIGDTPAGPFAYGGVIISNGDLHIDSYKPAERPAFYCANNHGSIVRIGSEWFIFYHRHTNGTNYSRQACLERLSVNERDAVIRQAMMTSCGSMEPLRAVGTYPTYLACNLFTEEERTYIPWSGWMEDRYPKITQDGADGDHNDGYVTSLHDGATMGFKYFDWKNVSAIEIATKGYGDGVFEVRTKPQGECCGKIPVRSASIWTKSGAHVHVPEGVHDLYFTYRGEGWTTMKEFTFVPAPE